MLFIFDSLRPIGLLIPRRFSSSSQCSLELFGPVHLAFSGFTRPLPCHRSILWEAFQSSVCRSAAAIANSKSVGSSKTNIKHNLKKEKILSQRKKSGIRCLQSICLGFRTRRITKGFLLGTKPN